jgi:hypothetical protein
MRNRTPRGPAVPPAAIDSRSTDLPRRRFLLSLGAGGATAMAAVAATLPGSSAIVANDSSDDAGGPGYRATAHVRDYYRTAKV